MIATHKVRTNVYLDADIKAKAQEIFKQYGMGLSDAFNIFLSQAVLERGIPFAIKLPNEETLAIMRDIEAGRNIEEVTLQTMIKEMDAIYDAKA
ncbi:MAG: type II toxin-antitoxin system RelB/DinJ family antitoxin [Sulfuricurvum sp.]